MKLPTKIDTDLSLEQIVHKLPAPYQPILGDVEFPQDEGQAVAKAIREQSAMLYSDGTVDEGC